MKTYEVQSVKDEKEFLEKIDQWPKAEIDVYPWGGDYRPRAYGICCVGPESFFVYLAAEESKVRCEVTEQNGPVCTDSCLEFFYQPTSDGYFNFEWNPKGVLHLGFGKERHGRIHVTEKNNSDFLIDKADFDRIGVTGLWYVAFQIPFSFIRSYAPEFDEKASLIGTVNFYKCGDKMDEPHWGCFSPVKSEKPDYHRPECFAQMKRKQ